MTNVLVDKTRDELDFLSQAVEPFVDPLLDILSEAPRVIQHNWDLVQVSKHYTYVNRDLLEKDRQRHLAHYLESPHLRLSQTKGHEVLHPTAIVAKFRKRVIEDSYKLVFPAGSKFNLFTGIGFHEAGEVPYSVFKEPAMLSQPNNICIFFMEFTFDIVAAYLPRSLAASDEQLNRAVEVAQLLDIDYHNKRKLIVTILSGIRDKVSKDTWKLRSLLPIAQVNYWVASYILYGELNNFVNLTHFKVMTHSGNAIYELSEVV